jgi:hypothetical protein
LKATQPDALLPRVEALRNKAVIARNSLIEVYPNLPKGDPRIVVARHIKAAVSSCYLSVIHLDENLLEESWWRRQGFDNAVQLGLVQDEIDDFVTLVAFSLVVTPFSLFEAGLRRIVRAVDPRACGGGTADFKTIYEWLFRQLRDQAWQYVGRDTNASAFLDLYRNVRNTIHNNGAYYSRAASDESVTWQGKQYDFVHGSKVSFENWDFNILIVDELIDLNREIMKSPLVAVLPAIS